MSSLDEDIGPMERELGSPSSESSPTALPSPHPFPNFESREEMQQYIKSFFISKAVSIVTRSSKANRIDFKCAYGE
jgi:hypothetical protein